MQMQEQQINTSNSHENKDCPDKAILVHSGEDYFLRARNIILNAKLEIHVQMYIFENDATGKEIINALIEAANKNVKVYILLDGYGSYSFPNQIIKELVQIGINIRYFSPFFSGNNFYIGRRMHHKIITADGNIALIGGINISNKYRGTTTENAWLDYAIQLENKEIVLKLEQFCQNIFFKNNRTRSLKIQSVLFSDKETTVNILQNDWLKRNNEIANAYLKSIRNAKNEIVIVGCYFLPGRKFTKVLKNSAKKGVKIKLILTGVSDIPFMKQATCHLYSFFLEDNIELYEWNKSVLHGKVALVDNQWATIGSFNLNHLSSYGSIETNVGITSVKFAETLSSDLYNVISQCEKITNETIKVKSTPFTKISNWLAYQFVRTTLIFITYLPYSRFMYKQKEQN